MVRIVKHANGNLNVWADYDTRNQVYCEDFEMLHLFKLKGELYTRECPERKITDEHIRDFMKTFSRLNDFHFDFTDNGIVYYTSKN